MVHDSLWRFMMIHDDVDNEQCNADSDPDDDDDEGGGGVSTSL